MVVLMQLTPAISSKIEPLLKNCKKFDMSIDSILEGQTGGNIKIILDNIVRPEVVQISQGTFTNFAGNSKKSISRELIEKLPAQCAIQPSTEEWMVLAKKVHGNKLVSAKRYSFLAENLIEGHLIQLINDNSFRDSVKKIDLKTAYQMSSDPLNKYHFMNYDSPEQFVRNGFGYYVEVDNKVVSACSMGLMCKKGVETCIITQPDYRKKGLATIVAAKFILHCLKNGLEPHWDAANVISCNLAEKLGYKYTGWYSVFYLL